MIEELEQNPQSSALSWLLEMEAINNPAVLNSLILNVFKSVSGLRNTEFVIDIKNKKLLIYLELKKFHEFFLKKKIEMQVMELFDNILPSFRKRIVFDRKVVEKALNIVNVK